VISFVLGIMAFPIAMTCLTRIEAPMWQQQEREAIFFFYRTMHSLFQAKYTSENGSISQQALETFGEYRDRLGSKCQLFVVDRMCDDYKAVAFFPSGDVFYVIIARQEGHWVLDWLYPGNWEDMWGSVLSDIAIDANQCTDRDR
jgi:hypothetical protein